MFTKLFFGRDSSQDQRLIDLQRRACWIGVACILQFLNEITLTGSQALQATYQGPLAASIKPLSSLALVASIIGSFIAMWQAFRPQREYKQAQRPAIWQRVVLLCCLGLACGGLIVCGVSFVKCFLPPPFDNDGTTLDTDAAFLLLQGKNPYTDETLQILMKHIAKRDDLNLTTPLRRGQFAGRLDYPTVPEMQQALTKDLASGKAQSFEYKVSYPAFSFLSLVPFAFLKSYHVLLLYFICHLLLIFVTWKYAQPEMRPSVLLLAFANVSLWTPTAGETLDILYTLLVALAWLRSEQRWVSILFLGLAIASKQIAWFFVPFYAIMIWWRYGWKEAMMRLIVIGSIGLAVNLPFILWQPQAWLAGVFAPLVDPMFPMGTGFIALSTGHLLPYFSTIFYTLLEGSTYGAAIIYYWMRCRRRPEAAFLLAVLLLFFAWRSLPSYFYCSAYPLLAVIVKKPTETRVLQENSRRSASIPTYLEVENVVAKNT